MGELAFFNKLNFQQTVRYGAAIYMVAAMALVPVGVSGQQYRPLDFPYPLVVPAPLPFQWAIGGDSEQNTGSEQPVAQEEEATQAEAAEPGPPFHDHILLAAKNYQVDPALIRAIILAESNYNPKAVSHRGARGLMQLMPTTAQWLGVDDSFDPALNIDGGVRYFKTLLDRFDGNIQMALAAYNAGSRYVRKYGGVPPFRATRAYIKKVLNYHRLFKQETAVSDSALTAS